MACVLHSRRRCTAELCFRWKAGGRPWQSFVPGHRRFMAESLCVVRWSVPRYTLPKYDPHWVDEGKDIKRRRPVKPPPRPVRRRHQRIHRPLSQLTIHPPIHPPTLPNRHVLSTNRPGNRMTTCPGVCTSHSAGTTTATTRPCDRPKSSTAFHVPAVELPEAGLSYVAALHSYPPILQPATPLPDHVTAPSLLWRTGRCFSPPLM